MNGSYAEERYHATTGQTERLHPPADYYNPPTTPQATPQRRQLSTQAILAIVLAALVLALVMRLGAMEPQQPQGLPGWAQHGYYQDSFNNSFNDNSWHFDM